MLTPQQFEELIDFLSPETPPPANFDLRGELAKRWPLMTVGEFKLAMEQAYVLDKERLQVLKARMEFSQNAVALMRRYPVVDTFGKCVKLGAADGDAFALWVAENPQLLEMEIIID
ncbi:hypothetical protein [Phyllobacterium sp. P5_D12]